MCQRPKRTPPPPPAVQGPFASDVLTLHHVQWLTHKALFNALRLGSHVSSSHLIASRSFFSLCSSHGDTRDSLFSLLFLPHLSVLSSSAAGARRVFGRAQHCFHYAVREADQTSCISVLHMYCWCWTRSYIQIYLF